MKKALKRRVSLNNDRLTAYACGCPCYAPTCTCNPANPQATVDYAQKYANNVQNDTKLLIWA